MFRLDDILSTPKAAHHSATLPGCSRCFRTAADGSIPLTREWRALLSEAHRIGQCALQTRHTCARLIATASTDSLFWHAAREPGQSDALQFDFTRWHLAKGFLRECECCASPGRVEVYNARGAKFLQLCAIPDAAPTRWAGFLEAIVAREAESAPDSPSRRGRCAFVRLREPWARVACGAEALLPLFAALGENGVPICCTLETREARHRREFVPREISLQGAILNVGERHARFQLAMPTVHSLALTLRPSGYTLHVLGRNDALLLSFSAAHAPVAAETWQAALRSALPTFRYTD